MNYRKEDRHIIMFYLYMILSSCSFSRGIFMIYLTHKGLNIIQVGMYQMLVQISMFFFEIPTGYIADKIGKIKSQQVGMTLLVLHCLMLIFFNYPIVLIALGIIEGIGYTFVSGSDSALLYELLKKKNRENNYLTINANLKAVQSIVTGGTISLGAILISRSWNAVYYTTAICYGGALLFLFLIKEPDMHEEKTANVEIDIFSKLRNIILYPNIIIFLICIVGFSCFDGIAGSYYNYNQIIFQKKDIGVNFIGIFFSVTYFANSVAYFFARYLSKYMPRKMIILRMMAFQGFLFALLAIIQNKVAFVVVSFICCLVPEVIYILADSIIQEYIASKYRATILSIISMLRSLVSAIIYSIFGIIMNRIDMKDFMWLLALVTIGSLCWFVFVINFKRRKQQNER